MMLSAGDDFPIHQRPEPVALVGTDRNFYDRYYFQGYQPDQGICFGAALGVYPNLNLMDAAFMVQQDGVQHSVFASRHLDGERMDTQVGPIKVQVMEPLRRLRIEVADRAHGFQANLEFVGRAEPVQEPRFTYRVGAMTVLDLTRMTQGGTWQGSMEVANVSLDVVDWRGARDRSWGIRPLGARDPRGHGFTGEMQWYWLWAPIHFDDFMLFFHTNDDGHGTGWNRAAVLVPTDGSAPRKLLEVRHETQYRPGTRQIARAVVTGVLPTGGEVRVELRCEDVVYKQGEGYNHPQWGHGMYHGALAVARGTLNTRQLDPNDFAQVHLHALCRATLHLPDRAPSQGEGVLEQMIVGPHQPSGFSSHTDVAR
jgi:hypothetical protein